MSDRQASIGTRNAAKHLADTSPGPWKAWKRLSRHARAIRFIETYCRAPKGKGHGSPLRLARFQKEWLEASLATGIDASVLATPRGNGKSTFGAGLALWATFDDDDTGSPQVPVVATTIGQAVRSVYGVAVAMVKAEAELERRVLIYTGISTPRVTVPFNGGELFPIANDPDGLQGLDPSLGIFDEIGFQPMASWDSLRMASGKRERSLVAGVGTPGFDHENALYQLRRLIQDGTKLPGFHFREYAAPDGCALDDRKAWRTANPALRSGFLRVSALETDLGITPEAHFRMFRLGQWVEGTDAWLGADGRKVWEGLVSPWDLVDTAPTWIGVDVGLKHDSTAVVAIQRRPDEAGHPAGRFHATCRLWVPTVDEPVDVTDVMQHLRDLADRYHVEAISFDPRFFDVPAKMLLDEGLPLIEVPQSLDRMTAAIGDLYGLIRGGRVTHDGDDAFASQVLAAVPRFNEHGFTLAKGKSRGRIDAAVALALAVDRAQRQPAAEPEAEPFVIFGGVR
jgi:phage terminase large subunit-like protein